MPRKDQHPELMPKCGLRLRSGGFITRQIVVPDAVDQASDFGMIRPAVNVDWPRVPWVLYLPHNLLLPLCIIIRNEDTRVSLSSGFYSLLIPIPHPHRTPARGEVRGRQITRNNWGINGGISRVSVTQVPVVVPCSDELAGVVGFEPTIHGTKNRCLTTWLHPNGEALSTIVVWRVQDLSRKK